MPSAVELASVGRLFASGREQVAAVHDVDLVIEGGQAVAITGPSGSGKTTLLNLIAGLDRPTTGQVVVWGTDLGGLSDEGLTRFRAQHLGFVFQDPHLLPGLTALENVVVARLPWGKRKQLEKEARKILGVVGLADRLDHSPARLSGGERQRVGIARALLGEPTLLLADEPTGNLDIHSTEGILELLTDLREELGLTVVTTTHDPTVAAAATRVIRLSGGTIESDSSVRTDQQIEIRSLG